jgi:hypothetical protein
MAERERGSGLIFLYRCKTIDFAIVPPRLNTVAKWPRKTREMKLGSPRWRLAAAGDPLAGLDDAKFARRARRGGKLRLFRVFKLLGAFKSEDAAPAGYRELGPRLREKRWLRRL